MNLSVHNTTPVVVIGGGGRDVTTDGDWDVTPGRGVTVFYSQNESVYIS